MMQHCLNTFGWRLLASVALLGACTVTSVEGPEGGAGSLGSSGSAGTGGGSAGTAGSAGSGGALGGSGGSDGSGGSGGGTAAFACGSRDLTGATEVIDDIGGSQTWSGTIHLRGSVSVRTGATLTIEPGTKIIADVDSELDVGWNGNSASLIAEGTPEAPILFCGQTAEPGFWRGILVRSSVLSNSALRNVLIADAGGGEQALRLDTEISVQNLQIENSGSDGLRAAEFADDSADLSVRGAKGVAVALTNALAVSPLPVGGSFSENAENVVRLEFDNIAVDAAFHDLGIPYVQQTGVTVTAGATVTFEAGVEYQFAADADLDVGWNGNDATLEVTGTAEAPVVFRGVEETPGFWGGLLIRSSVRTSSNVEHLVLRHGGGGGEPALSIRSAIELHDVSLEQNETGAYIDAQGLDAGSANLSITTTGGMPLTVRPNALITLPQGGSFTGNQTDQIAVEASDYNVSGTVPNLGVPYRILGAIDTTESSMTIAAGTHFIMNSNASIEFGWNGNTATVIAQGTADAPIRFTGLDEVAGYWSGLIIGDSVLSASKLDHVEVGHGNTACLTIRNPITVTNSSFFNCDGYGIRRAADDATDYSTTNTFTGMGTGEIGPLL